MQLHGAVSSLKLLIELCVVLIEVNDEVTHAGNTERNVQTVFWGDFPC